MRSFSWASAGGVKHRAKVGEFILPIAAIRGEGTSNDYFPPEVPALPSFALQRTISSAIKEAGYDYWTGTIYTTNRRIWEHDEAFREYLKRIRVMAVDMETATIFSTSFHNDIPVGALLLVSDQPLFPEGVKTAESDEAVNASYLKRPSRHQHRVRPEVEEQLPDLEAPEVRGLASPDRASRIRSTGRARGRRGLAIEAAHMAEIRMAATHFGSPSKTACQLATERQVKATSSNRVVAAAAIPSGFSAALEKPKAPERR